MPTPAGKPLYRVVGGPLKDQGINYGPSDKRVEPCDCADPSPTCPHVVNDIPPQSIGWLVEAGIIELVAKAKKAGE